MIKPVEQHDPLQRYAQVAQLGGMMDASQLAGLQRKKLVQDMAEDDSWKASIADWAKDPTKPLSPQAWAASPKNAAAFQKQQIDAQKSKAELEKTNLEVAGKRMAQTRDIIAGIGSEADLPFAKEQMQRLHGLDVVAQMPFFQQPFTPEAQQRAVLTADKLLERMTPKFEKVQIDNGGVITTETLDMNPFTNPGIKDKKIVTQKVASPDARLSDDRARQEGALTRAKPVWDEQRGVWVTPPGGGASSAPAAAAPAPAAMASVATPSAAATPAPTAPRAAAPGGFVKVDGLPARASDVASLRKEFNDLPEVKNFRAAVPVFDSATKAPDTKAGDIQFAYTIGKIFDPNSVVREGELKLVGDAANVMQKYMGELRALTEGKGRLTPQTRAELLATAQARMGELKSAHDAARTTYERQADTQGLPKDQIFVEIGTKPAAPKPPTMFDQMPDPSKYRGRRLQADDGTVYQSDGGKWVKQR